MDGRGVRLDASESESLDAQGKRAGDKGARGETKEWTPFAVKPGYSPETGADLEKEPLDVGINRVQWDGPTLVVHLKRRFGVKIKVRQAQYWLHQLGYCLKRAGYSYIQARSKEAKEFRAALKKTSVS
jgi:hypothetical protein